MKKLYFLLASLLLIVAGCSKKENGNILAVPASPTGLTATVISASQVNLEWADNSSNESGYKLERKMPGGSFVQIASTGADVVTYSDVNLSPATAYTYRVIANNSAGNSLDYSNEVTITTLALTVNLPSTTICNQIWSSQNIAVGSYRNGDLIPQVTDAAVWQNLTIGAWCWYNNDSVNYSKYGKLYNWYAVTDARGLAPQGWHVAAHSDWNKLVKCIDPAADTACIGCYQSTVAGGPMKSAGGWLNNGNGSNSSGFGALPGGSRRANGTFDFTAGYNGFWWTSSGQTPSTAWLRYLTSTGNTLFNDHVNKTLGYSVRVVRD